MCSVCKDEQCHWGEYCYPSGKSERPRMEVVDETIDKDDPRFRAYYPAKQHYAPGYWTSAEKVREGTSLMCWGCGSHEAPHVGHDNTRLCGGCLSQCVD